MIPLSNSDSQALCRYLKDAQSFYLLHSATTKEVDRARLLSVAYHKLARKILRTQCENIKPLIKIIQS